MQFGKWVQRSPTSHQTNRKRLDNQSLDRVNDIISMLRSETRLDQTKLQWLCSIIRSRTVLWQAAIERLHKKVSNNLPSVKKWTREI